MKQDIAASYRTNAELRQFLDHLPEVFPNEGTQIYKGRNEVKYYDMGGERLVVKRFKHPNIVQQVGYSFFRKSKAERAFRHGIELLARGIDTPTPVAYQERYNNGLLNDSYYISGWDDNPPVSERFGKGDDFDRELAAAFARFAIKLHKRGILHHDLNSSNTRYRRDDEGEYVFSVIDINRMDLYPSCPPLAECMENLTRFTWNMELFSYVAQVYAEGMAEHFHLTTEELHCKLMAQKRRHDRRRKRKKGFLKHFK